MLRAGKQRLNVCSVLKSSLCLLLATVFMSLQQELANACSIYLWPQAKLLPEMSFMLKLHLLLSTCLLCRLVSTSMQPLRGKAC